MICLCFNERSSDNLIFGQRVNRIKKPKKGIDDEGGKNHQNRSRKKNGSGGE